MLIWPLTPIVSFLNAQNELGAASERGAKLSDYLIIDSIVVALIVSGSVFRDGTNPCADFVTVIISTSARPEMCQPFPLYFPYMYLCLAPGS